MMWFFKVLGVSLLVTFIGWFLPAKRKPEPEPEPEPEHLWSREYRQMYEDCIYNAEHVYCRK